MRGIKIKKHKTKVKKGTLQNVNKNPSKTKKVNINKKRKNVKDIKKGTRQLAIVAQTHYRRRKDA